MGWPLGGNWDRATTPPGASGADLPAICAAICTAINNRALWRSYNLSTGAAAGTQYNIHYSLASSAIYPTAAQFGAALQNTLNGGFVQQFWTDCKTAIDAIAASFYTDNTFATKWTSSTLWTAAGTGLGSWDTTKNWWYPDNWLRIKAAVTLLRYYRIELGNTYVSNNAGGYDSFAADPGYTSMSDIVAGCPQGSGFSAFLGTWWFYGTASHYQQITHEERYLLVPTYKGALYGTHSLSSSSTFGAISLNYYSGGGGVAPVGTITQAGSATPGDTITFSIDVAPNPHNGLALPPGDPAEPTMQCTGTWNAHYTPTGVTNGSIGNWYAILNIDMASALADLT